MQLKSLWIKDYKNLKDFSLDFEKGNGLSILIGNNGSGKSNVLEAISGIFADWHNASLGLFDTDYRIEYELDGKNIVLERTDSKRSANVKNSTINSYLPSNVIALYSGEDLRLYENFYKIKYSESLKYAFQKGYAKKMGMYYVNKDLWNISLLTLILFMNNFPDVKDFLNTELGIKDDSSIKQIDILMLDWEEKNYNKTKNLTVKAFVDKITPEERRVVNSYLVADLRELISNSPDNFEAEPREVFNLFMQACMPEKYQIINGINITFNNGLTLESLSEGEKKLILIKAILEFVADEKSLLLLDEPDANIHEARKSKLYKLLKEYPNRQIVMTTHSPIIAKIASENELIYLESRNGIVSEISTDRLNLVKKLASDEWNIMEASVFLNSEKPLVLFEGKTDIDFVRRAIELLKEDEPKYEKIDVDFLSFNGTTHAARFIKDLQPLIPTRKLIVLCDNDKAGKQAIRDIKKIKSEYIKCAVYPIPDGISAKNFLLEDYFPEDHIKTIIEAISKVRHPYKELPNLGDKIKEELKNKCSEYNDKSMFNGFKPLLDKLLELLEIS